MASRLLKVIMKSYHRVQKPVGDVIACVLTNLLRIL